MNKKIGIITIHDIYNYGSVLQAYATQKILEDLNYHAEIIDYKYPNSFHGQKPKFISRLKTVINTLAKRILPGNPNKTYKSRYLNFKRDVLKLSNKSYYTPQDLIGNPPDYDVYISGSDQIWRTEFTKGDSCFFLEFVPKNKKRIAFASSFGSNTVPDLYKERVKEYLMNYSHLGVREELGCKIIAQLTGRKATTVLDPTLLIRADEWLKISKMPKNNSPYILCYGLNTKDKYMEQLAMHYAKFTGYRIIRLNGKAYDYFNRKMEYVLDAGPAEWLGYFANASLILAQSFHATAFAVNFNIPFYALLKGDENHDSRQLNLLEKLELKHRAIKIGDVFPEAESINFQIDFTYANNKLDEERINSLSFLINALA